MTAASVSRVPPLPQPEWTDVHRMLTTQVAGDSPVAPLLPVLLNAPEMVEAILPMTRYVGSESTLFPVHRVLLGLRTAWLDHSEAVWATQSVATIGVDPDAATFSFGNGQNPVVELLFRLADELVCTSSVSAQTWASLADGHDVTWLIDAVETVAHVSFLCCLANSFGVSADARVPRVLDWPGGQAPRASLGRRPAPTRARIDPVQGNQISVRRTLARHPAMDAARRPRADYVMAVSPLSAHDRETLILRIGWDCGSEYEWAKHVGAVGRARDHAVDPALVALGPTGLKVPEHDALLMRVADELHQNSRVADATWTALLQAYDLASAMSAVFTAASYRSTCMSLNAYGIQLEPGDEGFPAAHSIEVRRRVGRGGSPA